MVKSYGVGWVGWVAHGILVSALGPHFRLGLGLGPGLDNDFLYLYIEEKKLCIVYILSCYKIRNYT